MLICVKLSVCKEVNLFMKVTERRNIRKSYFVNAARRIIETEGMEGISARKVSQMAGYDASTLYNYFESLDHIIFGVD